MICLVGLKGFSEEADRELEQKLADIRAQNKGKGTDWTKLEAECLELVKDHNSPTEKGEIYATIARIYSEKGYSSSVDIRIAKALKYCQKALEYPLEVTTACHIYGRLTGAMMVGFWERPKEEFIKIRQKTIVPCLTGLKLALDHKAPEQWKTPPGVMSIGGISPNSPRYNEMKKKHEEQLLAQKKWEFENKLYFERKAFLQRCVSLYSHEPYNTDELKRIADQILRSYPDAVKELVSKVESEIARKEKSKLPDQGTK